MNQGVCRISIDVETGGDISYPLLEIGACVVGDEEKDFSVIIKPETLEFDRGALKAIRRPIDEFIQSGIPLSLAVNQFLDWIDEVSFRRKLIFVGLNMPFDWMFFRVTVAKVRATHNLPHKAMDIASYGAGVFGEDLLAQGDGFLVGKLIEYSPDLVSKYVLVKEEGKPHTGVEDAKRQGRLLLALEEFQTRKRG